MAGPASEPLGAPDVPEPAESGGLPEEAAQRIRQTSDRLPVNLAAVILLWFIYLLSVPVLWARYGLPALLLIPTAGPYLFSWLVYYRHELWHNYFPGIRNPYWFNIVSYLLFSDPQAYRLAHPSHHKYVHTPDDEEFFCRDWRTDRRGRKRQFILESIFGNIAWQLATFQRFRAEGRATTKATCVALIKRLAILCGLLAVAGWIQPGGWWPCLWTYAASVWLGAVMTRHLQWVEHLGIVSEGSLAERNLLTRNLSTDTALGCLFNFLNHDDAREHVLHHTEPKFNTRGVKGLTLPTGASRITLRDYLHILVTHYRTLDF
jgi:fatty acid desaturase